MMSGGKLDRFREGWALKGLTLGKAHYFRREGAGLAVSLCGSQDAAAGWLYDPGSFEHCKRCSKLLKREAEKDAEKSTVAVQDGRDGLGMKDGGDCA